MYAGVAVPNRLLGVPDECLKRVSGTGLELAVFRVQNRAVAIAWCNASQPCRLKPAPAVQADDAMGNRLTGPGWVLRPSPVYLVAERVGAILDSQP